MQQKITDIHDSGATLLAISPMLQMITSSLVKQLMLEYPVLCDTGNAVADKFGLVFHLADSLHPIYQEFGIDISKSNGDNSHKLPIPATYILDQQGIIRFYFADIDHTNRLDPDLMLKEIYSLTRK